MVIVVAICLMLGYVFGCFSTGYFVGKLQKVDIRDYGSGSAGTTNALRTLGAKAGIITLIGDMGKPFIPILLVKYIFFKDIEYTQLLTLYTGLGVVLGHNFPLPLKFKGGKGIAVTGGVMFAFDIVIFPFAFAIFVGSIVLTRFVSLGSLLVTAFFPIWVFLRHPKDLHMLIISLLFTLLAFFKHKSNIVRLINGTENKIGQKVKMEGK